ncbi:hypothetical protein CDAR_192701 [Caerostris darwini]|uniref:Uncharacterized protein n=1 Tax=Caerostris darwini TaxID=1538125 RepID=A0AAV4SXW9_9ARAC|nr:hypothetical protein CDAR_192701 [Caerostris darwini]
MAAPPLLSGDRELGAGGSVRRRRRIIEVFMSKLDTIPLLSGDQELGAIQLCHRPFLNLNKSWPPRWGVVVHQFWAWWLTRAITGRSLHVQHGYHTSGDKELRAALLSMSVFDLTTVLDLIMGTPIKKLTARSVN